MTIGATTYISAAAAVYHLTNELARADAQVLRVAGRADAPAGLLDIAREYRDQVDLHLAEALRRERRA
jgi:hypothetical protein